MIKKIVLSILFLAASVFACYLLQSKKKGKARDASSRYELVKDWPQLPKEIILGNPTGIDTDTSDNIVVFHRAGREWPFLGGMPKAKIAANTILVIGRNDGILLRSWGKDLFIMPHGLTVDRHNNFWLTDVGLHQVFKFSHDGTLLLTLGVAREPGNDTSHFNKPTDVAVAVDGSIYVSDGYGNNRVVLFSPEGKYISEWGRKGSGEGEFDIPHGIEIDERGNVWVADRENDRLQVFDSTGRFLFQRGDNSFANMCAVSCRGGISYAVDDHSFLKLRHRGSDILIFDTAATVLSRFGRSGSYNGPRTWYHDLCADADGNIYTGDILGNRLQKFRKTN
jgi:peptidylamidoglycolate lyase